MSDIDIIRSMTPEGRDKMLMEIIKLLRQHHKYLVGKVEEQVATEITREFLRTFFVTLGDETGEQNQH